MLRVLLGYGDVSAGAQPDTFYFNGRPYRGDYRRVDGGAIVNLLDLEQYLYAVVPREMSPRWPAAALQAQAICARTYVLQRSNPQRAYDLVPSEIDQVYSGMDGESPDGRNAVDATTRQVLRFGALFATVAYSSCCGGHTEASADAWGNAAVPYLDGVRCTYCTASPNYRWSSAISLEDVGQQFASQLAAFGALRDIRPAQYDPSGRVRMFELVAEHGGLSVKGGAFRLAVGPRLMRSLLITAVRLDSGTREVTMEGYGLGHGVGMCQWGARGMALAGRSARDVLSFYFPGTQVSTND